MELDLLIKKLTIEHGEQTAKTHICEYCMHATSDDLKKYGMEYFYINGHYDELQMLIDKNKASNNVSNRKWARVYQLVKDRYNEKVQKRTHQDMLKQANSIKTEEPALICVIEFFKVGVYNQLREYGRIGNFLDKQQSLFDQVEDQFLKSAFQLRLYQNLFFYHWVRNEVIVARKYAFRALNLTSNVAVLVNMNVNLGLTYLFDTYKQGMYHLNKALCLAEENHLYKDIEQIKNHNIPFLSAHFKQVDGIETTDKSEIAHMEIAKGNLDKAEEILSTMEMSSPFKLYYVGLAKQNKNILLQSYNLFIEKRSDYFFSRLPLNAIKNM